MKLFKIPHPNRLSCATSDGQPRYCSAKPLALTSIQLFYLNIPFNDEAFLLYIRDILKNTKVTNINQSYIKLLEVTNILVNQESRHSWVRMRC